MRNFLLRRRRARPALLGPAHGGACRTTPRCASARRLEPRLRCATANAWRTMALQVVRGGRYKSLWNQPWPSWCKKESASSRERRRLRCLPHHHSTQTTGESAATAGLGCGSCRATVDRAKMGLVHRSRSAAAVSWLRRARDRHALYGRQLADADMQERRRHAPADATYLHGGIRSWLCGT